MVDVNLEIHDDVISVINKIKDLNDAGVSLNIPEGSVLFDNILNLKLLKKEADKSGKTLSFQTEDLAGQNLLTMLNEEEGGNNVQDFSINETPTETVTSLGTETPQSGRPRRSFTVPKMPAMTLPQVAFSKKYLVIAAVVLFVLLGVFLLTRAPKATAKIVVNSSPLTKSVTIKAIVGSATDPTTKTIRATTLSTDLSDSVTETATGTKLIGKTAKGSITIYNKTDAEREFKKGATLSYKKDGTTLKFVLTETATVPARTQDDPDPLHPETITYTSGQTDFKAEGAAVGTDYNITSGKSLDVDGKSASDFSGKTATDFTGGASQTVKAIAEADKTKAATELLNTLTSKGETTLKSKLGSDQKLIAGSLKVTPSTQSFNHLVGDQADSITLTQTVTIQGLTYFQADVEGLLTKLSDGFVPDGYVLSDKDKQIDVQALGQTDTSVLTSTQADLQVTIKTYIVPNITEDTIKDQLAGKSVDEAKRILGGIKNIKTYEFSINPSIPFLQKVPKDKNKIFVTIERN
ncbi:MAG TPA: hypothetical protein VLI92_04570 [Candidatus Saccharimonadales bacterium]|nr:hypothetical protein [Candidatus Saccharimonadales bacterium]